MRHALLGLLLMFANGAANADPEGALAEIESDSHQQWLVSDLAALDALMAEDFRFIAMNGAVETKQHVIGGPAGGGGPRVLEVRHLEVETDEVITHGDTAVVIARMRLDASVRGRVVPENMRILSVYRARDDGGWSLIARSITPVLAPPPQ